jgi:hypothetical protein
LVSKISDQVGRPKTDLSKLAKAKQQQKRQVRIVRRMLPAKTKTPQSEDVKVPQEKHTDQKVTKPDLRPCKKCPHCGEIILANRLLAHMEKVHGSEPRLPVSAETFVRSAYSPNFEEVRTDNVQPSLGQHSNAAINKQEEDAKFGWGSVYRDHGQFGSYPAHDDMGDDSGS